MRLALGKHMTQTVVARAIGVDSITVSRWERGFSKSIDPENARRLAQLYGRPTDEIIMAISGELPDAQVGHAKKRGTLSNLRKAEAELYARAPRATEGERDLLIMNFDAALTAAMQRATEDPELLKHLTEMARKGVVNDVVRRGGLTVADGKKRDTAEGK